MCSPKERIKFCTCLNNDDLAIIQASEQRSHFLAKEIPIGDDPYTWSLYSYSGPVISKSPFLRFVGLMVVPDQYIDKIITNERLIQVLNLENCFDFDYRPLEGDILTVSYLKDNENTGYLSFKFENGKWDSGYYNCFDHSIELKNFGRINLLPNNNESWIDAFDD
jgi:hypothetical protein